MIEYVLDFFRDPTTGFWRRHTPLRIFNLLTNQIARRIFKSTFVPGYPIYLTIESTNYCNLNCPMCSTGQKFSKRPKGQMSFGNFKKIIDRLGKYLYGIGPYNLGEPLLNKDIYKMIEYANKHNLSTLLSTNGLLLFEDNIDKLIASGLEKLIISIDAATEETYKQNRPGGDFNQLKKNIKTLMAKKKKQLSKTPFVSIMMIIMKNNEAEIELFKKMAQELGVDKYLLATYWEQYSGDSDAEKKTRDFWPSQDRYKQMRAKDLWVFDTCRWAWSGGVINWDGTVIPCCYDYNESFKIGNIFEQDFKAIWNNSRYLQLRKIIKSKRVGIPLCQKCPRGISQ